jgi:hypothetical protein
MKHYYSIICLLKLARNYFQLEKPRRNINCAENVFLHGVLFVFTYFIYLNEVTKDNAAAKKEEKLSADLSQTYLRRFVHPNVLAEVLRFFDKQGILIARRNDKWRKGYQAGKKAITYELSDNAAAMLNTLRRVSAAEIPITGKTPLERFKEYSLDQERKQIEALPHVQRQKEDRAKTFFDNGVYEAARNKADSHHKLFCYESAISRFLDTDSDFITNVSKYGRIYSRATEIPSDLRPYLYFDSNGEKRRFAECDVKTCQPLLLATLYSESPEDQSEKRRYNDLCREQDFYSYFNELAGKPFADSNRSELKGSIYHLIYGGKKGLRHVIFKALKKEFPILARRIEAIKKKHRYEWLSREMQRAESKIVVGKALPRLQAITSQPVFTIHDCLMVPEEHAEAAQNILTEEFAAFGLAAQVKIECHKDKVSFDNSTYTTDSAQKQTAPEIEAEEIPSFDNFNDQELEFMFKLPTEMPPETPEICLESVSAAEQVSYHAEIESDTSEAPQTEEAEKPEEEVKNTLSDKQFAAKLAAKNYTQEQKAEAYFLAGRTPPPGLPKPKWYREAEAELAAEPEPEECPF